MVTAPLKPIAQENPFQSRLETVLCSTFPDSDIRFEPSPYLDKVAAYLVWQGFERQPPSKRQEQVWQTLRANFAEEDLDLVLLVVTLTPDEEKSIAEDF